MVVLNSGDLTAEEADAFQKQKEEGIQDTFIFYNTASTILYRIS